MTIAIPLKQGFLRSQEGKPRSTIWAAAEALKVAASQELTIVYLEPGLSLQPYDGLLLPGGEDVDPRHYGRPDLLAQVETSSYEQDAFELSLAQSALSKGIPILGVCRGFQVLNVAHGGTLVPRLSGSTEHFNLQANDDPAHRSTPVHSLRVAPASRLFTVVESERTEVNSIHRGGIEDLGQGLRATAWADDGVIEAIESEDGPWRHAVLFHPEELFLGDQTWQRFFQSFVEAVRAA